MTQSGHDLFQLVVEAGTMASLTVERVKPVTASQGAVSNPKSKRVRIKKQPEKDKGMQTINFSITTSEDRSETLVHLSARFDDLAEAVDLHSKIAALVASKRTPPSSTRWPKLIGNNRA